ncbi:hypothetical protein EYS09_12715 [Streptomyces kasugaensis]|uniref:Uncharacterized protein n=1 Tax=Streptomyces kasugaensis TaxID=1946 RepID=A0A4Q9HVV9_STRKA|nr:hypothetical protein [Streptomyces kasugaensis]TBO59333.1 hypothetical protein EYS09_12715 [Streptomyces kasugaensis]
MSEKQSKTEWTSDKWHKVCGEFTFHPFLRYQKRDKKDQYGAPIWGVEVPDLNSAWWDPMFEFAYDIWTSNVVSSELVPTVVTQRGDHVVGLFAAIYTQEQWDARVTKRVTPFAKFTKKVSPNPSYTFRETFPTEQRIECDSGKYYVEWSISRSEDDGTRDRQGDGGPQGLIVWDSDAAGIKHDIAINQNIYG